MGIPLRYLRFRFSTSLIAEWPSRPLHRHPPTPSWRRMGRPGHARRQRLLLLPYGYFLRPNLVAVDALDGSMASRRASPGPFQKQVWARRRSLNPSSMRPGARPGPAATLAPAGSPDFLGLAPASTGTELALSQRN